MTRIRFEDLPSTNTPRNAENLNKLNNVVISSTEPTTGEELWLQKGKNLLSNTNWEQGSFVPETGNITSSQLRIRTINFIKIIPNVDYYISVQDTNYCYVNILFYNDENTYIGQYFNLDNVINGATSLKVNFPTDCTKVKIVMRTVNEDTITPNLISTIKPQLEQSDTATSYEPYIDKKIYTKNDNGEYEEFYNEAEHNKENYSLGEQIIGTWIDGKPLYRKTFPITNITSSNTNLVNISGLNIDVVVKLYGILVSTTGNKYPIPLTDSSTNYNVIFTVPGAIRGRAVLGDNGSIVKADVTLEYTKTTD